MNCRAGRRARTKASDQSVPKLSVVVISLGSAISLFGDHAAICHGEVGCRWPLSEEQLQKPEASTAASWANAWAAQDEFRVVEVRHYP
jgi:hypothetical protein